MPNAVWYDLLTTTQTVLQQLGLTYSGTPLPSAQVYVRKRAGDRNTTLPFLMAVLGGSEEIEDGTFEDHEWIFPVLVVHCFASNQDLVLSGDELTWRERIIEAFSDLPRPEVTIAGVDVNDCQVVPDPALDLTLFSDNLDVGGLLLRFRCTKSRNRA